MEKKNIKEMLSLNNEQKLLLQAFEDTYKACIDNGIKFLTSTDDWVVCINGTQVDDFCGGDWLGEDAICIDDYVTDVKICPNVWSTCADICVTLKETTNN